MKKILKYIFISFICFLPFAVNALTCSPKNIKGDGVINFSHCMVSRCDTYKNGMYYVSTPTYTYPNSGVVCNNGNDSPKVVKQVESDCPKVGNICNVGEFRSCTVVIQYDCNKTSSGASYYVTTTTKKTTTKKKTTKKVTTTTQAPTTTKVISNTKLNSLTILDNNITFNPDVYEYNLKIGSDVNSLNITAIPQDSTTTVQINGNSNLANGSIINIILTGSDNTISIYKINIEKEVYIMSNNAKLESLNIQEYNINFNNRINAYTVMIDSSINTLTIDYKTEDDKATVSIDGNENLVDGSKVVITVKAEDGTENKYTVDVSIIKQKSSAIKYIFIIILVLALGAGGYYIYMKFFKNKGGDKYEYE